MRRCSKVPALCEFISCSAAQPLKEIDAQTADLLGLLAHAEIVCFKARIVEAVEQEIGQIRYDSLCTLGFEKLHQMIVGSRMELDKNLADNTDTRFPLMSLRGRLSKSRMISRHIFLNLPWRASSSGR